MKTIILRHGKWYAKVIPEFAMNVLALEYDGEPILRCPEQDELLANSPFVYGTPLLIPPNATANDTFTFDGKEYTLEYAKAGRGGRHLHGMLYNADMTIVEQTYNMVKGEFVSDLDRYPFPFKLTITCLLDDGGLHQTFAVSNVGQTVMPLVFGLHTTFFAKPLFTASIEKAWVANPETRMPAKLVELNDVQRTYVTGTCPSGVNVHGQYSDNGEHTATIGDYKYTLSDNFCMWVIWNKGGEEGFISLEPQSGPINALNMPEYVIRLEPGQEEVFRTTISRK